MLQSNNFYKLLVMVHNAKFNLKNIVSYALVCMMFLSSVSAFAQNRVKGTVKDENGAPLPGVSVVVKHDGKLDGTITDWGGILSRRISFR